jgi:integrase
MRLSDYPEKEGKRVWLTVNEIERLAAAAADPVKELGYRLAGQAGLRRSEVTSVTWDDFAFAPDGFVRVWSDYAKRDQYREAPVPDDVTTIARTLAHERASDAPVVDVSDSTVYRSLRRVADDLESETGDRGWSYLDVHDLRRSWGGHLLWDCGLSPMAVMEFGGWSDWSTFEEHYMGEITPEAMDRERAKIDYMGGEPDTDAVLFKPESPAAAEVYGGTDR